MIAYLKLVMDIFPSFKKFELAQILRFENAHAGALSKLASIKESEQLMVMPIEHLTEPSIAKEKEVMRIDGMSTWMQHIVAYLKDQVVLDNKEEAYKLRRRSAHFVFLDDMLYKRGFSSSLIRCVGGKQTTYSLHKIHEKFKATM